MSPSRILVLALAALAAGAALPPSSPRALAAVMPTVVSVFPMQGPAAGGTAVTITGTDFFTPMVVRFDGLNATLVAVVNQTTITCLTPAHVAGVVDVAVAPASDPVTLAATLAAAYTYLASAPSYVWVPRGPGSAAGGYDVSIVDYANRREAGKLDLNTLAAPFALIPGFPALPGDDDWCVTQVLFDSTGELAFLATAGRPGTEDSMVIYIVSVAQAVRDQAGAGLLAALPAVANPYQLAFSSDQLTLYAADGGSWSGGATTLVGRNGAILSWDLADLASLLTGTIPTQLPVARKQTVGPLPLLQYDRSSNFGWGTNSSFRGTILSRDGFTVVTNAFGNTLMKVRLSNFAFAGPSAGISVGIDSTQPQTTTSIPSPFEDDIVFVETFERGAATPEVGFFRYSISQGAAISPREVVQAVRFFNAPALDLPDLRSLQTLHVRTAWPYPGATAMATALEGVAYVASWDPAGGEARLSPDPPAILQGGLPTSLAYNDATGFFYAREGDGGWTVLGVPPPAPSVPDACPNGTKPPEDKAPALAVLAAIDDTEGADSLRVVGNGSFLVGTTATLSKLVVIEGRKTAAPADIHRVTGLPIDLSLDPAGGPVFPQPGSSGGTGRSFPTVTGGSSMRITGPVDPGIVPFGAASLDDPPVFTGVFPGGNGLRTMIEFGTQYDFLPVPGSHRVRVRFSADKGGFHPSAAVWKRLLRTVAAGGNAERPFYARLIAVNSGGRAFSSSPTVCFHVAAPTVPVLTTPGPDEALVEANPPTFVFDPQQEGAAWLMITVPRPDSSRREVARVRVGPGQTSLLLPQKTWSGIVAAAVKAAGTGTPEGSWTLEVRDAFGRIVPAADPNGFTITLAP